MKKTAKDESKAKGGVALAKAMTPEERKARAKKGAVARWGAKPLQATHTGNFKNDFGIDVDCYVLNDENKMAVISKRGMGSALGYKGDGGSRLAGFIKGRAISQYAGRDLIEKLDNPIVFQGVVPGATSMARSETHGYDVTILIDLCKVIIQADADGKLLASQANLLKQANIILGASAKAGIQGLVYALAGYDRTKDEVIAAYKMYVMEEAREYEKEFSPELYEQWYRLYGLVKPERGRPWEFKYLTIDHIYKPLAKSNGKVFSLAKSSKQANGGKGDKIHQFLSEIGVKALRTQVGKITGIAIVSESRAEYERHIAEKVYGQKSFSFDTGK